MTFQKVVLLTCCLAFVGCGKGAPKPPTEAEKKAMDDKMKAEMMKMMGQMPADGKLPKAKMDNTNMMKGDAPPKKP